MSVKFLTGIHVEFLSLKEAAKACLSLHLTNYHIVGNHMSRLMSDDEDVIMQIYNTTCYREVPLFV